MMFLVLKEVTVSICAAGVFKHFITKDIFSDPLIVAASIQFKVPDISSNKTGFHLQQNQSISRCRRLLKVSVSVRTILLSCRGDMVVILYKGEQIKRSRVTFLEFYFMTMYITCEIYSIENWVRDWEITWTLRCLDKILYFNDTLRHTESLVLWHGTLTQIDVFSHLHIIITWRSCKKYDILATNGMDPSYTIHYHFVCYWKAA